MEEAETQPQHGDRHGGQEDDVDVFAVQSGEQWCRCQVAHGYQQLQQKIKYSCGLWYLISHLIENSHMFRPHSRVFEDNAIIVGDEALTTESLKYEHGAGEAQRGQDGSLQCVIVGIL